MQSNPLFLRIYMPTALTVSQLGTGKPEIVDKDKEGTIQRERETGRITGKEPVIMGFLSKKKGEQIAVSQICSNQLAMYCRKTRTCQHLIGGKGGINSCQNALVTVKRVSFYIVN